MCSALNKVGAVSNYINVMASEDEFHTYFLEAQSKCIISLDLFIEKSIKAAENSGVEHIICFSLSDYMPLAVSVGYKIKFLKMKQGSFYNEKIILWKSFINMNGNPVGEFGHSTNLASIWGHTSGTIGFPKTVLLSNKGYNEVVMQYLNSIPHKKGEIFLNILVSFVVYGMLICMYNAIMFGTYSRNHS